MDRIELNVATGERKVIQLTPGEETDALARTVAEAANPRPKSQMVKLCDKLVDKLVLTQQEADDITD